MGYYGKYKLGDKLKKHSKKYGNKVKQKSKSAKDDIKCQSKKYQGMKKYK